MKNHKLLLAASVLSAAMFTDGVATAAQWEGASFVLRTRTLDEGRGGACQAQIGANLSSLGLVCAENQWITFDCTGELAPKDHAYRAFDLAQMALALGYRLRVHVDDTITTADGYCYADKAEVIKP